MRRATRGDVKEARRARPQGGKEEGTPPRSNGLEYKVFSPERPSDVKMRWKPNLFHLQRFLTTREGKRLSFSSISCPGPADQVSSAAVVAVLLDDLIPYGVSHVRSDLHPSPQHPHPPNLSPTVSSASTLLY